MPSKSGVSVRCNPTGKITQFRIIPQINHDVYKLASHLDCYHYLSRHYDYQRENSACLCVLVKKSQTFAKVAI